MNWEVQRKEFETYWSSIRDNPDFSRSGFGDYKSEKCNAAWVGWIASARRYEPPDKGLWRVGYTTDSDVFLESDDFTHDVRLAIGGDFAAGDMLRYARQLARWLNYNLPPRCECKDPKQCWEPCGELGHSDEHCVVSPLEIRVNAAVKRIKNMTVDELEEEFARYGYIPTRL